MKTESFITRVAFRTCEKFLKFLKNKEGLPLSYCVIETKRKDRELFIF